MRDIRFRRALSLGIDRHEINQALYFGLAIEGQNTVLPAKPAPTAPSTAPSGRNTISTRRTSCSTSSASPSGAPTMYACCRTDGRARSSSRIQANRAKNPTCSNWIRDSGGILASSFYTQKPAQLTLVPPPGVFRRNRDVARQGYREWPCDRGNVAGRIRADQPAAARMAEMGQLRRDERQGRRGPRPAAGRRRKLSQLSTATGWATSEAPRTRTASGMRCWQSSPTRCFR